MSTNWDVCPAVERAPEKLGGALEFHGTRMPVATLFENLREGGTVDQFLEWYPGEACEQVEPVLNHQIVELQAPVVRRLGLAGSTGPTE